MSARILKLISHFAVYTIGAGVLVAAVLVTAVRMVLPDIGIYRTEVEAWVGNYMGYPVAIRSLDADWQGWVPNLSLANIDVLNSAGTQAITHFESAQIAIDPVATLLARRIVPQQLVVSGFDVSIVRRQNGAIFLQGINVGTDPGANTERSELADWLFRQERIRIERGTINWTDNLHGQESILLTNVTLTLRSDKSRLQVEGSTSLPPAYGKNMDFAFDASGDLLTSRWAGEFYLSANDINPDNWYRNYRPGGISIDGGSADLRIWSSWADAKLASLQGQVTYRDFVARVDKARLHVDQLGGSFNAALSGDKQWQLGLRINKLETENGAWPETDIRIEAEAPAGSDSMRNTVTFNYLKLADVAPLILALPRAEGADDERLQHAGVRGELQNGLISFGSGNLTYNFGFRDLDVTGVKALPGVENASGRLRGNLTQARVQFQDDALTLHMPGAESATLALDGLQGTVAWERTGAGWQIGTDALALRSPDASAHVAGRIVHETASDKGPFFDISAHAGSVDAVDALGYLPLREDSRLRQWLARSVVSGSILSGDLMLRGYLGDFPFRHREGRFAALINAEDVTLDYSEKWPPIDELSGEIEFDGPEMVMRTTDGRIFDATFADATARIRDIRAPQKRLLLDGKVSGRTRDLGLFIQQSPLSAEPILSRLPGTLVDGDMDLDLAMSMPLGGTGTPAELNGKLQLIDARLNTELPNLALHKITGAVEFTRDRANGSGIQAQLHGQPVELAVFGDRAQPTEPPRIDVRGTGDDTYIRARLEEFFPGLTKDQPELFGRLRGTTDWTTSVSYLDTDADGKLNRRVTVRSDLAGLAVDLPAPLGKAAAESMDFTLTRILDTPQPGDVELRYGGRLAAGFSPRPGPNQPPAIAIQFGDPESAPHSDAGIRINGTLDTLPAMEWWDVLREVRDAQARHGAQSPLDISATGQVRLLHLLGQEFHDVEVDAARADATWNFNLRGAEIDGRISIPGAGEASQPIQVDLARLKIAHSTGQGTERTPDPRVQLPLQVSVAELDFHGHPLGAMKLVSSHVDAGMKIDSVEFIQPGLAINGSGTWLREGEEDKSHFEIKVHADAMDDMLRTFGYNVAAVRKGRTELDIDAGWSGTPMAFSWANLNGTLHMQVNKGQLLDIEPKAGRLFGLLSFQSLPRRLSLDFTDLFGKGMAFDRIEGTFDITGGNAFTNDLHLRGPSADVAIAGRTGLAVQDYDQIVTVTPQVTESLPVAGALFGPVGIGVGAVIYLAGEIFDSLSGGIGDLLRYQYTVTGSWDNPVIEKIDGKDKGNG